MLYNRAEHSQDFFICFTVKIPVTSLPTRMSFKSKLYFSNKEKWRQHTVYPAQFYDINTPGIRRDQNGTCNAAQFEGK